MSTIATNLDDRLAEFERACQSAHVKVTHQRLEVFREVISNGEHPNAETILEGVKTRLPMVSLDTVYRTLWLLTELGLIGTLEPRQKTVRFDANLAPHHHFICVRCAKVFDIDAKIASRIEMMNELSVWGSIQSVRIEARGVCSRCAEAQQDRESIPK